ncbi:hypothetical protein YC2023_117665 [Brassica napus]
MTNSSIRFSTTTSSSITCRTHLDPPVTARASFQSVKKTVTMNQIISRAFGEKWSEISIPCLHRTSSEWVSSTSPDQRTSKARAFCSKRDLSCRILIEHLVGYNKMKQQWPFLSLSTSASTLPTKITNSSTSKISGCGREEQSIISSRRHLLTRVRSVKLAERRLTSCLYQAPSSPFRERYKSTSTSSVALDKLKLICLL